MFKLPGFYCDLFGLCSRLVFPSGPYMAQWYAMHEFVTLLLFLRSRHLCVQIVLNHISCMFRGEHACFDQEDA